MPSIRALPPEIEQALARDWVVLTANQRAARTLRHAYDLRQQALGRILWEPPPIFAWETWTNSLWIRLLLDGRASDLLLSPAQERTLWHAIIAADTATASLRPDALAQTAADAWKLLHDYRGRQRLQSFSGNTDTRAFARWVAEFERRCARGQYLTEAQLAETLRVAITAHHLTPADGYLLVGFDTQTPAQLALLDTVRSAGAQIDSLELSPSAPGLTLASAPDEHTELVACARWLRAQLTEQPHANIAVVVSETEPARAEIDRVFRQVLAPELNQIAAPAVTGPYEFSLGVPLVRAPLVAAALDILRWAAGPLPFDRVSNLLLSPHFAADSTERIARAEFDAFALRGQHLLEPQLSLDRLLNLASQPKHAAGLPTLLDHLRALRPLITPRALSGERTHADWAAAFHQLLEAAGWAPLPQLDSTEFQTRAKWDDTLDELATLDFDGVRVSFPDALTALERIATETLFAPESRHAPIQIMGPLESAGSTFDAVWFLRANDVDWPATLAPNPLLPWLLQRELAMPGANPILHTAQARRTTERIAASAPTAVFSPSVVFSYAQQSADGPQRSSPILAHLALDPRRAADLAPAALAPAPLALNDFADDAPIPPPPDRVHQGGAAILQAQAACGFRAFAEKRLYSSALEAPSLGLDPRDRGSIVHAVLEEFWAQVKTQAALKNMPNDERVAQLNRSIDIAFNKQHARPESGWPRAYLNAERDRLLTLLGQWLDYEANHRKPFTIQSLEGKLDDVSVGQQRLRLDVRVDRVDTCLSDGQPAGEIILDYKTGAAAPKDWLGPRPDAPQLPLYAVVSAAPHLTGVAFASVRPGNLMGLSGYESQPGVLPDPKKMKAPSLAAQVDEWREVLTSLADEFHAGNASVSPKHYPQTCEYCEQRLLCRLDPSTLDPDILEEIEDESDPSSGLEEDELV